MENSIPQGQVIWNIISVIYMYVIAVIYTGYVKQNKFVIQ